MHGQDISNKTSKGNIICHGDYKIKCTSMHT